MPTSACCAIPKAACRSSRLNAPHLLDEVSTMFTSGKSDIASVAFQLGVASELSMRKSGCFHPVATRDN